MHGDHYDNDESLRPTSNVALNSLNAKSNENNQVCQSMHDDESLLNNKTKLTIKTNPPNKHPKAQARIKKSDLAVSNASVVNQAVESATAIFNSKNPFSTSTLSASTLSNYNVNLIPMEIGNTKRLTTSSSDYSLKDMQFRRFFEKKKEKSVFDEETEEAKLLEKN